MSLPVARGWAFASPPQSGLTGLCFLFPLIEPDRRISRIRLSEKGSRCRPRKAGGPLGNPDQPKLLIQQLIGVKFSPGVPPACVSLHRLVGFADRTEAKVVRPTDELSIES